MTLDFHDAYEQALARYLRQSSESRLEPGDELGRRALTDGVSVLDIVEHHVRLEPTYERDRETALQFLLQTLAPLDIATRGFAESARGYQTQLARAEALAELDAAKTRFFQNVSHEFRTPLTLLLGPVSDLLGDREVALPPTHAAGLAEAHRAGQRLRRLVEALLDIARADAGELTLIVEPTDLARLSADSASMFRAAVEGSGLELVVDAPPVGQAVLIDRERWTQVVWNLLSNAVKFTPSGTIKVMLRAIDDRIELTVADTGIGIPPDELPNIFTRFHQVPDRGDHLGGTGIGLSLTRDIVRAHGGDISVDSAPEQGSTFTVSVPLRTGEGTPRPLTHHPEQAPAPARDVPAGRDEGSVLVVEDNDDLRSYISRLLRQDGWAVDAVPDAEAALRQAQQVRPDLVLSDIMLPGRDGLELLRTIRTVDELHHVPVILLTARAGAEAAVEGLSAGADDYVLKPFDRNELLTRVRIHVELTRLRDYALNQAENKVANLETALVTNRQIGAAMGIVMAREKVTSEEAFQLIRKASQRGHRKLRDIADQIVYTGTLPPG